ncbi:S26 family signal peptidase [Streptomyces sp. NPDC050273]|uniref:S26 family signal peptidase n=1 Tax=unclassified Streptomyces TaxID=2593676 RepID=UPI003431ABC2
MSLSLLFLGVCAGCWRLKRRLIVVTVHGASMLPTYGPGDRLIVRRGTKRVRRGNVVVIEPPSGSWGDNSYSERWLIKRVAAVPGDIISGSYRDVRDVKVPPGKLILLGDNQDVSMDSRQLGLFFSRQLLGTVWFRLEPGRTAGGGVKSPLPDSSGNIVG